MPGRFSGAGKPDVWAVDLRNRGIDVYRQAAGNEYREHQRVGPGQSLVIPGVPAGPFPADTIFLRAIEGAFDASLPAIREDTRACYNQRP